MATRLVIRADPLGLFPAADWGAKGGINPGCFGPDAWRVVKGERSGCRQHRAGEERDLLLDTKQYRKMIICCWKLADKNAVPLRRRYRKEVRLRHGPTVAQGSTPAEDSTARPQEVAHYSGSFNARTGAKVAAAHREEQEENFTLYRRVLDQKPQDTDKIYSLHEPPHLLWAKGKEHKKYEFGTKASVAMTKTHSVIVAAVAHEREPSTTRTLCPKCSTRRSHDRH